MKSIKSMKSKVADREKKLVEIKRSLERTMSTMPKGSLNISMERGKARYYHFTGMNVKRRYLSKNEMDFIKKLAQKDYNNQVLKSVNQELKALKLLSSTYPEILVEDVYNTLALEKQVLVTPVTETASQFADHWQSKSYQGKAFRENDPELYTAKGERVRSKSEVMIADALGRAGIPYKYECPLELTDLHNVSENKFSQKNEFPKMYFHKDQRYADGTSGSGEVKRTVYPDFTILNVKTRQEIYWEHFGRMDDPEYAEKTVWKINLYMRNNIFAGKNLIMTFETRKNPLNQQTIINMIKNHLV